MIKVVLDTNVYLSGIIFGGKPKIILSLIQSNKLQNYTSLQILLELSDKLHQKFLWTALDVQYALKAISITSIVIKPKLPLTVIRQDPTDNKILECARDAKVDYIITGDKHLLQLKRFGGIEIVRPGEFLKKMV
ncbi:putative toxin-antitoxin system toxin component, PIN family [Candidatus Roizmanbacteria bacterium]|nr:putative toxin-antitoxin system toxin component, PIN family [Candidatus Roizmanbacteria bacterium]